MTQAMAKLTQETSKWKVAVKEVCREFEEQVEKEKADAEKAAATKAAPTNSSHYDN